MFKDYSELNQSTVWHEMMTNEWKSTMSTELTSMADRNISGFIIYDRTTSREL
jgi:hypothetical protein